MHVFSENKLIKFHDCCVNIGIKTLAVGFQIACVLLLAICSTSVRKKITIQDYKVNLCEGFLWQYNMQLAEFCVVVASVLLIIMPYFDLPYS